MYWILFLLIILIPLIAQIKISINYKRYNNVANNNGKNGCEIAREILKCNNLSHIDVVEVRGDLTDHYDPKNQVVRLSSAVYHGKSISSTAIAAHECGHAVQDKEQYKPMMIRSMIVPIVQIATTLSYWILLISLILNLLNLIYVAIFFTLFGLLFQLITLPVEFNASKRAKIMLDNYNLITGDELKGIRRVLSAAAMTYVAGVLSSALEILRLLLIAQDRR